ELLFRRTPILTHQYSLMYDETMRTTELSPTQTARLFQALSDETRLRVIDMLASGEKCVCDLQDALGAAQSRLSFHLKVLREAGLANDRKQGRWNFYSLKPEVLDGMAAYLQERKPDPETGSSGGCGDSQEGPCGDCAVFCAGNRPRFVIGEDEMGDVREVVRELYGQAAPRVVQAQEKGSCCGTGGSCGTTDPITRDLYDAVTTATLPEAAVLASLGCGNPTALAELNAGEVVLDLGSGGGIDVLLS